MDNKTGFNTAETQRDLAGFTGTGQYYKASILKSDTTVVTDGVQYVRENLGAYWLVDLILSYQYMQKLKDEPFQKWELRVNLEKSSATLFVEDGDKNKLFKKDIPYTDFPLSSIVLWKIEDVILLPSEY